MSIDNQAVQVRGPSLTEFISRANRVADIMQATGRQSVKILYLIHKQIIIL